MPTLRAEITLTLDGEPLAGFDPLVKTITGTIAMPFTYVQGTDGTPLTPTPVVTPERMLVVDAMVIRSDKDVSLKINSAADAVILRAGGIMLLLGVQNDGTNNNAITNVSGSTATISGLAVGT